MEITYRENVCVIYQDAEVDEKLVRVRSGLRTLIGYSENINPTTLQEYLGEQESSVQPKKVHVHESCRRDYALTI